MSQDSYVLSYTVGFPGFVSLSCLCFLNMLGGSFSRANLPCSWSLGVRLRDQTSCCFQEIIIAVFVMKIGEIGDLQKAVGINRFFKDIEAFSR